MSNVVCLKMLTGEDVIGDVVSETVDEFTVKNPAAVVIQPDELGRMGVALMPYAPFAKNGQMVIFKHALAGRMEIDVNLQNEYSRRFGSGIQIASAGSIAAPR